MNYILIQCMKKNREQSDRYGICYLTSYSMMLGGPSFGIQSGIQDAIKFTTIEEASLFLEKAKQTFQDYDYQYTELEESYFKDKKLLYVYSSADIEKYQQELEQHNLFNKMETAAEEKGYSILCILDFLKEKIDYDLERNCFKMVNPFKKLDQVFVYYDKSKPEPFHVFLKLSLTSANVYFKTQEKMLDYLNGFDESYEEKFEEQLILIKKYEKEPLYESC